MPSEPTLIDTSATTSDTTSTDTAVPPPPPLPPSPPTLPDGVPGRYTDGRTARTYPVGLAIDHGQLVVERAPGDGATLSWPLPHLSTAEPILTASTDVLIQEPGRAGATVFVADPEFVRALGVAAPHLTANAIRWRAATPFMGLTIIVAALAAVVAWFDLSPARTVAGFIPHQTRAALGQQVVRTMIGTGRTCSAPAGVAALDALSQRLSQASGSGKPFSVTVFDSPTINAFAAPGEVIVLMRGLIAKAESADEVAGVLAHEMGHGIELHPEAGIVRGLSLAVVGELVLGGSAGGSLASAGLVLNNLRYSRAAEHEADAHALRILKEAKISPAGLARFFERMSQSSGKRNGAEKPSETMNSRSATTDMLRTHPTTAERLERVRAAIGHPATPALDAAQWAALRDICRREGDPIVPPAAAPKIPPAQTPTGAQTPTPLPMPVPVPRTATQPPPKLTKPPTPADRAGADRPIPKPVPAPRKPARPPVDSQDD
jgi:Zn-dependent protease with chaperone function